MFLASIQSTFRQCYTIPRLQPGYATTSVKWAFGDIIKKSGATPSPLFLFSNRSKGLFKSIPQEFLPTPLTTLFYFKVNTATPLPNIGIPLLRREYTEATSEELNKKRNDGKTGEFRIEIPGGTRIIITGDMGRRIALYLTGILVLILISVKKVDFKEGIEFRKLPLLEGEKNEDSEINENLSSINNLLNKIVKNGSAGKPDIEHFQTLINRFSEEINEYIKINKVNVKKLELYSKCPKNDKLCISDLHDFFSENGTVKYQNGHKFSPNYISLLKLALKENLNKSVTILDFTGTSIKDHSGLKNLMEGLKENPTVQSLILDDTKLDNTDVQLIVYMLKHNTTITDLCLRHTDIDDDGAEKLLKGLKGNSNSKLQRLDLSDTPVNKRKKAELRQALEENLHGSAEVF